MSLLCKCMNSQCPNPHYDQLSFFDQVHEVQRIVDDANQQETDMSGEMYAEMTTDRLDFVPVDKGEAYPVKGRLIEGDVLAIFRYRDREQKLGATRVYPQGVVKQKCFDEIEWLAREASDRLHVKVQYKVHAVQLAPIWQLGDNGDYHDVLPTCQL